MNKLTNIVANEKGLSLMETLVAVSLGSAAILGSLSLLMGVEGTMTESREAVQVQQEARNIVECIAREVRESCPDKIQITSYPQGEWDAETILFHTPRDEDGRFVMDNSGKPDWQREIAYELDRDSHYLYRSQYYLASGEGGAYQSEVVSKNVERLNFAQNNDMLLISIRTFVDTCDGTGYRSRAYADFQTMVKLRN